MGIWAYGLDALVKFSTEHWEKWSEHVGKKQVLDLANSEWNRINQSHGWVARIQHAVQQVVPAVHDVLEQWNLLAVYELYTGTLLKVPDLVFMPSELERDKPKIWVKGLDQYRVACMKLLSGKRQKVETPDAGGGGGAAQEPKARHRQGPLRSWTQVARRRRSISSEHAEMKGPGGPRAGGTSLGFVTLFSV